MPASSQEGALSDFDGYCSKPNSATPVWVPTKTLPLTMTGVMNLFPGPNWSRDPA